MDTSVFSSVQLSCSVVSNSLQCNPMDCSMPGFPVHHQLPEFAQIHVHQVGDASQTISSSAVPFSSRLQSFPASGFFQMSQFLHQVGKVLEFQFQNALL